MSSFKAKELTDALRDNRPMTSHDPIGACCNGAEGLGCLGVENSLPFLLEQPLEPFNRLKRQRHRVVMRRRGR